MTIVRTPNISGSLKIQTSSTTLGSEIQKYFKSLQYDDFKVLPNLSVPYAPGAGGVHDSTTHCNTLQNTATLSSTVQHSATRCNTLQHTATHCSTLQHTVTHALWQIWAPDTVESSATLCNTLQHSATHCNKYLEADFWAPEKVPDSATPYNTL